MKNVDKRPLLVAMLVILTASLFVSLFCVLFINPSTNPATSHNSALTLPIKLVTGSETYGSSLKALPAQTKLTVQHKLFSLRSKVLIIMTLICLVIITVGIFLWIYLRNSIDTTTPLEEPKEIDVITDDDQQTEEDNEWKWPVIASFISLFLILICFILYFVITKKNPSTQTKITVDQDLPNFSELDIVYTITYENGDTEQFIIEKEIGNGASASVFRVRQEGTNRIFALKRIPFTNDPFEKEANRLLHLNEVTMLDLANGHPLDNNIISPPHWSGTDKDSYFIILDYIPNGTLQVFTTYDGKCGGGINLTLDAERQTEKLIAYIAKGVLTGLAHLHKLGIIHKDIKPSNLGVGKNGEIILFDFGFAERIGQHRSNGSPLYLAPEISILPWNYNENVDSYSLGISILELFYDPGDGYSHDEWMEFLVRTAKIPHNSENNEQVRTKTSFGWDTIIDQNGSENFKSFLQYCLTINTDYRWSAVKLLSHPFITSAPSDGHLLLLSKLQEVHAKLNLSNSHIQT